ncbi:MAG TPA: S1/P1 nuclease [Opitutaceae bacterium]|nr:S1/P1 nuclease [Opitutaceae bacterium]
MKHTFRLFFVAVVLALPSVGFAWNNSGHELVAMIAYEQLDPTVQDAAFALLQHHPHFETILKEGLPANADVKEWVFLHAATWPDRVRPDPRHPELKGYHHGSWHYINYPYVLPSEASKLPALDPNKAIGDGEILIRLAEAHKVIGDKSVNPAERAIMLAWLLHLVGDLHQPLHATSLVTTRLPDGDKGGNSLLVRALPSSSPIHLHAFWDDALGHGESLPFLRNAASEIRATFDIAGPGQNRKEHKPETELTELRTGRTYRQWAQESYNAAVEFVYLHGALPFSCAPANYRDRVDPQSVPILPSDYSINARAEAQRRMALAGCRIANELEQILK